MMAEIELNNIVINAEFSGTGNRSVILIHELGGSLRSFDGIAPLFEKQFQVLRYDQRGAGRSEKPPEGITLENHIEDLRVLINWSGLPSPYLILGAAAGSVIAIEYAMRPMSGVERLVLCAPAISMSEERREDLRARARIVAAAGMRSIVTKTLDRSFPPLLRGDGTIYDTYRARFLTNDALMYARAVVSITEASFESRFENLKVPCLVLAGVHDLVRSVDVVANSVRNIHNKSFKAIQSGHLMAVYSSELVFEAVMEWINHENGMKEDRV